MNYISGSININKIRSADVRLIGSYLTGFRLVKSTFYREEN